MPIAHFLPLLCNVRSRLFLVVLGPLFLEYPSLPSFLLFRHGKRSSLFPHSYRLLDSFWPAQPPSPSSALVYERSFRAPSGSRPSSFSDLHCLNAPLHPTFFFSFSSSSSSSFLHFPRTLLLPLSISLPSYATGTRRLLSLCHEWDAGPSFPSSHHFLHELFSLLFSHTVITTSCSTFGPYNSPRCSKRSIFALSGYSCDRFAPDPDKRTKTKKPAI